MNAVGWFIAGLLAGLFLRAGFHKDHPKSDPKLDQILLKLVHLKAQLRALAAQEESDMSKLSDAIAAASTSADAAIGRVQEDVAALEAKIAELEAIIAEGNATQADLDALDALKAKLDALDPTKPATLPEG